MTAISTTACGSNGAACTVCDAQRADNCDTGGCRCGTNAACTGDTRCVNSQCVCDAVTCSDGCCQQGACVRAVSATACGANGQACAACDLTVANNCGGGSCRCGTGAACGVGQRCFNSQCVCDATSCADGCCAGQVCNRNVLSACGTAGGTCAACDTRADNCGPTGCRCGSGALCAMGVACVGGSCAGTHTWTLVAPVGAAPAPRSGHMMAFDTQRNVVVLFGGEVANLALQSETWEYNPSTRVWTNRNVAGPPARKHHVMAYDPVRHETVLFGGTTANSTDSATWVWDGTTWTQRVVTGPSARALAGMAWNPVRQRLQLFGGRYIDSYNDVWEWSGTAWTELVTTGTKPVARAAMGVAFDEGRGALVVTAGRTSNFSSDTFDLVGTVWQPNAATVSYREYVTATWDAATSRVVLVGGVFQSAPIGGAMQLDGQSWVALSSAPTARYSTAMVYDPTRQKLILFGGYTDPSAPNNGQSNDLWEY